MRILLLAPHPFYQERGTPIAVDLLLRALAKRGDRVDVLTFPEGEDRDYGPGVAIHRVRAPGFLRNVRPGFTVKKCLCDVFMFRQAVRLARAIPFDCVHAVEEAGFMARYIARKQGIAYVFDMDSSMPRQIADKMRVMAPLLPLMRWLEGGVIRKAAAVAPMCEALAEVARAAGARRIEVLRDVSLVPEGVVPDEQRGFRADGSIRGRAILYLGNLESYQGIDLLLEGFARLCGMSKEEAQLVIAGGRDDDIETYRRRAASLGVAGRTHFLGRRPLEDMPHLFHDCDVLVSPRVCGENTPMKVYSYLGSGKPLVATRLPTHTQVLDDEVALLVEPTAEALASGLDALLRDAARGEALAGRARELVRRLYSPAAFEAAVDRLYAPLCGAAQPLD